MRVDGNYIEIHGPYPILMNKEGINIYTNAHVSDASDQIGRMYIGREELKCDESDITPCLSKMQFT